MTHKTQTLALGSIPHERTNERAARTIRNAMNAGKDPVEQEKLHSRDEDTTWFGITWDAQDDTAFPILQDHGRYAAILDNYRGQAFDFSTDWNPGLEDRRYPGLVSFIGQTG